MKHANTFLAAARTACASGLFLLARLNAVQGQVLTAEFVNAGYAVEVLGIVPDLPSPYGGLTIRADEPNTLYIGGSANTSSGAIYAVPLIRDGLTNRITGFAGPAVLHATGPFIDGGLSFTPSGTLLFTQYTPLTLNSLGQILPDGSYVTTQITSLGVSPSIGSHAFVPDGYPGAGNLIVSSYNASILYRLPFSVDGDGLHAFGAPTAAVDVLGTATGPEGIAYVPLGSAAFPVPSLVVSAYGLNKVVAFEVGPDGLPNTATARDMVIGLTGAEGAWIDPLTGDYLFSTFGGGSGVVRVSGFELPSSVRASNAGREDLLHVAPNPSDGRVRIDLPQAFGKALLEVIDPSGAVVLSEQLGGGGARTLDLSGHAAGVYMLRVLGEGEVLVRRLVLR